MARIAGSWESSGGRFLLLVALDGGISILMDGTTVLEDTLQFSYLQPGFVAGTEFSLSQQELFGPDGIVWAKVDSLCYENDGAITLVLEMSGGDSEMIVFQKIIT